MGHGQVVLISGVGLPFELIKMHVKMHTSNMPATPSQDCTTSYSAATATIIIIEDAIGLLGRFSDTNKGRCGEV